VRGLCYLFHHPVLAVRLPGELELYAASALAARHLPFLVQQVQCPFACQVLLVASLQLRPVMKGGMKQAV
jgi:hypothetical protein